MEAGLIFVQTNDIFSEIILSITKEEYNYIGFYLNTDHTGLSITKVFLFDIFKGSKIDWIPELPLEPTLEHISSHPLVTKIVKKKLRNLDNLENFKLGILTALNSHQELEIIPAIYKLFGYTCDPVCIENKTDQWCSQSATDLINNTFINLEIWDSLKFTEPDLREIKLRSSLSRLASNFTTLPTKNLNVSSFLTDTLYFEKFVEVEPYNLAKWSEELEKYQKRCVIKISELLNAILLLTSSNKSFEGTLVQSLEYTRKNKSQKFSKIITNFESQILEFDKILGIEKFIDLSKSFIEKLKNK